MLSLFLVSPLQTLYPIHPPPVSEGASPPTQPLPLHSLSILLCWGIKPPQDQGPPLPLIPAKAILCYMCNWSHESLHVYCLVGGLVPGSSGGGVFWFIDNVILPMGLQTPSTSSVLSLTPPLQSPCSVRWLAASIHICICQTLAEPLRGQPYQAPTSKSFLALAIVSMFGVYRWDESPGGAVSG